MADQPAVAVEQHDLDRDPPALHHAHCRPLRGTLGDIAAKVAAAAIERTALVLVGRALAAQEFRESALYDPGYRRRFRGGERS